MKYTLDTPTNTSVIVDMTLDADDLRPAQTLAIKHLSAGLQVPGFRKGKVPASVAKKNLDPTALATHTAENAINSSLEKVIEDKELRVLDRPRVDIGDYDPEVSLTFKATIEVLPDVQLGDYKKLKLVAEKVSIEKKDVDEVIERIRKGFAEKKEVKRVAKDGDEVWIDFDGVNEAGEPVAGASGKEYPLALGSNTFIPGFEEGLVGKKAGDEFDLPLTFPKDYHAAELAGAKVIFKTKVNKVMAVTLPKLDDELAAKAGPFTSADDMKADIERELTAQAEKTAQNNLKDDAVRQLAESSDVPTPEVLVKDQLEAIERDTNQNLTYRGMDLETYAKGQGFKDTDEWREKEARPAAIARVKAGLVLAELSKVEKIQVSQAELEERLEQMKAESPHVADQFDTPEARRNLANRVLTEKTVDYLLEQNPPKTK